MAFLTQKNHLFFKSEQIQCSIEDKHVFSSPFVFPKPTIRQKEKVINSENPMLYYDKTIGDYQIICALYHVEKERFKIKKYLKPLNNKTFTGIHLITAYFQSPTRGNIFHFKSFNCDFYVDEEFSDFSPNEILFIVSHLFERKDKHNINYVDLLKKYIVENSLCNNKSLNFEQLKKPFSAKDILEYGLVHFEHNSTNYNTEKEAYSDALITQLKHPIVFENGNAVKTVVLIYEPNDDLYEVNFLNSCIFTENLNINWKRKREYPNKTKLSKNYNFYVSDFNLRGINFFNGQDYLKTKEEIPAFSKFLGMFSHGFTFFNCIEDYCTFFFDNNKLDGEITKLHFGEFFTLLGIKSEYNIINNQYTSAEKTKLKNDIANSLLFEERDIINAIINEYKQKKEAKEVFFFESKGLNEIIQDPLYLEQKTPEDFELLKMNYQDIEILAQYINSVPKLLLHAFHRAFNDNNDKHILEKTAFYIK